VKLTTHLHIVPSSRMCGALLPLPQYVFMARCLVKHRNNFIYFVYVCQYSVSRGSSISKVTGYRLDDRGSFSGRGTYFSPSQCADRL